MMICAACRVAVAKTILLFTKTLGPHALRDAPKLSEGSPWNQVEDPPLLDDGELRARREIKALSNFSGNRELVLGRKGHCVHDLRI